MARPRPLALAGGIADETGTDAEGLSLTHTTTLLYKARNGAVKELQVVQPIEPGQIRMELKDLQILAREIANVLREDG